eukprot:CAMPEP_0170135848 /NCGR_PEP_ID=MMETSP0033_2-20121228/2742_1 /TAXON_ID=195969 /ORGANISM="Dolichomastix tenuilepis, Strain CCMP3274" /LENGTH=198 /DNA_ID=CAMNT_0010371467 /DNA_START=98 /DNA_END=691 /DNA_ORIENTATION=-
MVTTRYLPHEEAYAGLMPDKARAAREEVLRVKNTPLVGAHQPRWVNETRDVESHKRFTRAQATNLLSNTHLLGGAEGMGPGSMPKIGSVSSIVFDKPELPGGWNARTTMAPPKERGAALDTLTATARAHSLKAGSTTHQLAAPSLSQRCDARTERMRELKRAGGDPREATMGTAARTEEEVPAMPPRRPLRATRADLA